MGHEIEFFFDLACPYSYLAATQLTGIGQFAGVRVRWRPFLLDAVLTATGNGTALGVPAKKAHLLVDLRRWAKEYGIEFSAPAELPPPTLLAQKALVAAATIDDEMVAPFALGMFRCVWVENKAIESREVISVAAEQVGLPSAQVLSMAESKETSQTLEAWTKEAVERGAFGAPTFFLGDEMYFGNDRLSFLENALRRS